MIGFEVTIGNVIAFFSFGVAAFAAIGTAVWRIRAATAKRITTLETTMHEGVNKNKEDLAQFKLHVAEKFVKSEDLGKLETNLIRTEERTLAAIGSLTERLDRFFTQQAGRGNGSGQG